MSRSYGLQVLVVSACVGQQRDKYFDQSCQPSCPIPTALKMQRRFLRHHWNPGLVMHKMRVTKMN